MCSRGTVAQEADAVGPSADMGKGGTSVSARHVRQMGRAPGSVEGRTAALPPVEGRHGHTNGKMHNKYKMNTNNT